MSRTEPNKKKTMETKESLLEKAPPEQVPMPVATTIRIWAVGFILSSTAAYNVGNMMYLSYRVNVRYLTIHNFKL